MSARGGHAGAVPGQRKRKRRKREAWRRFAARTAPDAGHWEVVFETQDESRWLTYVRALRTGEESVDLETARVDTLCGRLSQPTTYRLSVFVPDPAGDDGHEGVDQPPSGAP